MTFDPIKRIYNRIINKVRRKDFRLFLMFVVVASVIWFMERLRDDYTIVVECPIEFHDVPMNYSLSNSENPTMNVTLRGDGFTLLSISPSDMVMKVNIARTKKINEGNTTLACVVPSHYISDLKEIILDDKVSITGISPDTLFIPLQTNVKKDVRVVVNCKVVPELQYNITSRPIIDPKTVTIYGNNDIVNKIDSIVTYKYDDVIINDTTIMEFELMIPEGVTSNHKKVRAKYCAELFTEKSLSIPISAVNIPDGYTFRPFPHNGKVTFSVGISRFDNITANDFILTADLADIVPGSGTSRTKLRLTSQPEGVLNISYSPLFIEYLLEKKKTLNSK